MLHKFLISILLICPVLVFGQDVAPAYKNQLKISPLRLIDIANPGIEILYERSHSKLFSTELSVAYMGYVKNYDGFRGFKIGAEEKYFIKTFQTSRRYLSAQFAFNQSSMKEKAFDTTLTITNPPNIFTIEKKTATINIKYGSQIFIKPFVIDFCMGAGVRYRDVKYENRNYSDFVPQPKDWNFRGLEKAEGRTFNFVIPVNVTFGYMF